VQKSQKALWEMQSSPAKRVVVHQSLSWRPQATSWKKNRDPEPSAKHKTTSQQLSMEQNAKNSVLPKAPRSPNPSDTGNPGRDASLAIASPSISSALDAAPPSQLPLSAFSK